jgi:hypothetical protein
MDRMAPSALSEPAKRSLASTDRSAETSIRHS